MNTTSRVEGRMICRRENNAGGTDSRADGAWSHNTHSHCACRLITRARNDRRSFTQTGCNGTFGGDKARDFG
jgi:hypothetical protein